MNLELPDINIQEISKEILLKMDFDKWKWICKAEGCECYSHFKEYGAWPMVYFNKKWIDITKSYMLCRKHWKIKGSIKLKQLWPIIDETTKTVS